MGRINIAELLKDCPKGMELDCTMYDDVYFDYVDKLNIIHCYIQHETYNTSITFNQHGTYNSDIKSKCAIFPKGKTTWEGFHRPLIMTREEEIKKAGIEYTMEHNPMCIGGGAFADIVEEMNRSYAFEAGAKWADETMINKACEWLVDNARNYIVSGSDGCWYDSVKLKHAFKRAMEE